MFESIDTRKKHFIYDSFKKNGDLSKIISRTKLSRNEIISILYELGICKKELATYVAKTNISNQEIIVISDTHIGSVYERIDYLNLVYNYAKENNIHHIIHGGDLLQGTYKPVNKKYNNFNSQIKHFEEVYPEKKNITTHILFGNHDYHVFLKHEESFKIISKKAKFDILGFKKAYFRLGKFLISINHEIESYKMKIPYIESDINLVGHSHDLKVKGNDIYIPTLSDDLKVENSVPGFILINIIDNELIIKHIDIDDGILLRPEKLLKLYKK